MWMWNQTSNNRLTLHYGPRQCVPCNLTLDRAWRWCIQATLRDMRMAGQRHREMSQPNLRRLFTRRWSDTCRLYDIAEDSPECAELLEAGLAVLSRGGAAELRRMRGEQVPLAIAA